MSESLLRLSVGTQNRLRELVTGEDRERGDVPGWVMVTLMTAGIVSVVWTFAQGALKDLFDTALQNVQKGGAAK